MTAKKLNEQTDQQLTRNLPQHIVDELLKGCKTQSDLNADLN